MLGAAQSGRRSSLRLLRVLRDEDVIAEAREDADRAGRRATPTLRRRTRRCAAAGRAGSTTAEQAEYLEQGVTGDPDHRRAPPAAPAEDARRRRAPGPPPTGSARRCSPRVDAAARLAERAAGSSTCTPAAARSGSRRARRGAARGDAGRARPPHRRGDPRRTRRARPPRRRRGRRRRSAPGAGAAAARAVRRGVPRPAVRPADDRRRGRAGRAGRRTAGWPPTRWSSSSARTRGAEPALAGRVRGRPLAHATARRRFGTVAPPAGRRRRADRPEEPTVRRAACCPGRSTR